MKASAAIKSLRRKWNDYVPEQLRFLFILVGIPLLCLTPPSIILLYLIGGTDMLRFALRQLFTWNGAARTAVAIFGLAAVTWARHAMCYQDEPPPMWFRRSIWLNILEALILLGLVVLGIWAIPRFGNS